MLCQRSWIWVDWTPGDGEIDMKTPFEKDKTLDECKSGAGSDGICDGTLVGNPHDPCNLFPLNR
jgi:hypothetical protein